MQMNLCRVQTSFHIHRKPIHCTSFSSPLPRSPSSPPPSRFSWQPVARFPKSQHGDKYHVKSDTRSREHAHARTLCSNNSVSPWANLHCGMPLAPNEYQDRRQLPPSNDLQKISLSQRKDVVNRLWVLICAAYIYIYDAAHQTRIL